MIEQMLTDAFLDAGEFGAWLEEFRASLRGELGTNVPCGDCVGCCVSSYYIPIRFQDQSARARIPVDQLVAVSGQPAGDAMMRYESDGTCPMLNAGKCSIYEHRPQTCRDYDCRIFAATNTTAGGADKAVINARVLQWRFTYRTEASKQAHQAIVDAAKFIKEKRASFPNQRAPTAPAGIAVLAIKSYALFLDPRIGERSDNQIALDIIKASGEFDSAAA